MLPAFTPHFSRTLPPFCSFLPSSLPNVQALKISKGVCLPCVGQGGCVRQDGLGVGAKAYSPDISVVKGKSSFFSHVTCPSGLAGADALLHTILSWGPRTRRAPSSGRFSVVAVVNKGRWQVALKMPHVEGAYLPSAHVPLAKESHTVLLPRGHNASPPVCLEVGRGWRLLPP